MPINYSKQGWSQWLFQFQGSFRGNFCLEVGHCQMVKRGRRCPSSFRNQTRRCCLGLFVSWHSLSFGLSHPASNHLAEAPHHSVRMNLLSDYTLHKLCCLVDRRNLRYSLVWCFGFCHRWTFSIWTPWHGSALAVESRSQSQDRCHPSCLWFQC